MSRNLCTSSCCGNTVRLSDLRGKPIEFRRYHDAPPAIGTKWTCPDCGTVYFVIWRDAQWSIEYGDWVRGFVLDLSYYESFNDEHRYDDDGNVVGLDEPWYLCQDNAEIRQTVW